MRSSPRRHLAHLFASLVALAAASTAGADDAAVAVQPRFSTRVDVPLFGSAALLLGTGAAIGVDEQSVPDAGLDPAEIWLDFDRDRLGRTSVHAYDASDVLLATSFVLPVAFAAITAPGGTRLESTGRRALLFGEALLLTDGIVGLTKTIVSRPRPFNYLGADERPDHTSYDVRESRAFVSMPSGHAAQSYCAATFIVTDHLMTRPDASWLERAGVGFLGGTIATATAALRVSAGQHFPTDTWVGAPIGAVCGIAVPLLHRWQTAAGTPAPRPTRAAWGHSAAGLAAGIAAGFLVAEMLED